MRHWLSMVIVILMVAGNIAHAGSARCYAPSPNLSELGDEYYNLENTIQLSNDTKGQIHDLLKNMAGKWQGQARTIECRGADRAPIINTRHANLTANIKLTTSTRLAISAKKHDVSQNIKKSESVPILGNTPTFDLEIALGQRLVFAERYRLINQAEKKAQPEVKASVLKKFFNKITGSNHTTVKKPKSTRLMEIIYALTLQNHVLQITRSFYTNGVFTGSEQWVLSPQ